MSTCPCCQGEMAFNYCNLCGFPPDDLEYMAEFNRREDRDSYELRCQEFHNSLESGIEENTTGDAVGLN